MNCTSVRLRRRTRYIFEHLERGFATYLDLLADNWAEIYATIQAG
jgi:hypothetical protein